MSHDHEKNCLDDRFMVDTSKPPFSIWRPIFILKSIHWATPRRPYLAFVWL